MVAKGFKQMLAEAGATVEVISAGEAVRLHGAADVVFVDVRESQERSQGAIARSVHAPRGFLEFIADPEGPMHEPALASGKTLVLYCASGGRSMLAARTLQEMGIGHVYNLVGGYAAWTEAGGPVEP